VWLRDQLLRNVFRCSALRLISRERVLIEAGARPFLPRGVRLRDDPIRAVTVLLAPERVLYPDSIGIAILRECNGENTIAEIATQLALRFEAPVEQVRQDTVELLQDLADRGYVAVAIEAAP
jgi:pyrroloquinoline quinone biosynthesis protein D